jgi:hypothetical protein
MEIHITNFLRLVPDHDVVQLLTLTFEDYFTYLCRGM